MQNSRMHSPFRNLGPSASQSPPIIGPSQTWPPNVNQDFSHSFRTNTNQRAPHHVGSGAPKSFQFNERTQQTSLQFPPNVSPIPQFPPPPPNNMCSTNQSQSMFSSQGPGTIGPQYCMNTNATNNNNQYFPQSNSLNWFPSPATTFNHSMHLNNTLPPCTLNSQSHISPNDQSIPSNFSISTPPPTFSARFHTTSTPSDFKSHVKIENPNGQRLMPPSFSTNSHQLQPVVHQPNVHQQQINQNVIAGVNQVKTVLQSSFHVPQNLPFMVPPVQNPSVYPLMQPSYHVPVVAGVLHSQTPVVKHETMEQEEKNADDVLVKDFLAKVKLKDVTSKIDESSCMTIPEFQCLMKIALSLLVKLTAEKTALSELVNSDEDVWNEKLNYVNKLKEQFSKVHCKLSSDKNLSDLEVKLKKTARKRQKNLARRERYICLKRQKQQDHLLLHQEADLWLETLREKDLQKKKEAEMKKEADSILSEVRKKVQEAKRTIEKLKIFEKLRQARKEHAQKKGMFVHFKSDMHFKKEVSEMKKVMLKQLSDYEAEEKALQVMLETEQEGQLEAEAQWKLKQLKKHQERKCNNILDSLFGHSEPPKPNSPQYFFWQHYNAGNCDISNFLKIRHDWDMYLVSRDSKEGSGIPQRWVVPEAPSSDAWSFALEANSKGK